jgi:hypothetical protein
MRPDPQPRARATTEVTVQVGPSTLHRVPTAPDRYRAPAQAAFEWTG